MRHRLDCKLILEWNIKILNILARILARIQLQCEECSKTGEFISREEFKALYMEQVAQFETKEEVLMNRVRMRKYLRELLLN